MHPIEAEVPLEGGLQERCDESSGRPIDMDGDVQPGFFFHLVKYRGDLLHWFVHAGVRHSHDDHHANGVLVDVGRKVMPVEGLVVLADRNETGLDFPVVGEFLLAHLYG